MAVGWHDVTAVGDIPVGGLLGVVIEGRAILVCHVREGWHALDDACTHAAAPLHEGWLRGCRLVCPLHGAAFDVRDGRVLGPPASKSVTTHRVRIAGDRVEVALAEPG